MRWILGKFLVLCLAVAASAGPCPRDQAAATVRAATERAVAALYEQVAAAPLGRNITVGQFVDRADGRDLMLRTLQRAELIGGPRWLDEKTCQVQLEISGQRVATALNQIAAARPDKLLIPPEQIPLVVLPWVRKTFSASGSSTAATELVAVAPAATDPRWQAVSEKKRAAALAAARDDAKSRLVQSVSDVSLNAQNKLGQAMVLPSVKRQVGLWLDARPVDHVRFGNDLVVEVSLAVERTDFFQTVRTAVAAQDQIAVPREADDWKRVETEFCQKLARPIGRATATAGEDAGVTLPARPPEWVDGQIEANGQAVAGPSKLKAAVAAEADARAKVRRRLSELPLNEKMSLGEAAGKDRSIEAGLSRAVAAARIVRTQYLPEGGARVWLVLDLREAWAELRP